MGSHVQVAIALRILLIAALSAVLAVWPMGNRLPHWPYSIRWVLLHGFGVLAYLILAVLFFILSVSWHYLRKRVRLQAAPRKRII